MAKPTRRSRKTSTSSFGSPGRVSHNAAPFYNSRLYAHIDHEQDQHYLENPVPGDCLDSIICASSQKMDQLPDQCVHLMVTSPPYNVGKEYDLDLSLGEYLQLLRTTWSEVYRVLVPGGRACVNIANLGRRPYLPLHAFIIKDMLELGYMMRGEVIWNKAASSSASTAWGSWRSAANPTLRDVHEYILVFSKTSFRRLNPADRRSTIGRDEFLEYSKSVWNFPAESARKVGHPAPFPVELPRRLIQLYTFEGEVILDPFMGSGQTALAALLTGRHFIGYEVEPDYVKLAEGRISASGQKNSGGLDSVSPEG